MKMKCIGRHFAVAFVGAFVGNVFAASGDACCKSLSNELPSLYYGPSSPEYERSVKARWSGTAILHPACVIVPQSASDLSKIMKILIKQQCKFAVKSGGHNANPGANSIDGGVSIDLGQLNSVSLASDRSFVSLGSGATWGQAYDKLNTSNIGFPGGVCGEVGIGGPSLAGGQSLFQAEKGWIVDNVLNFEIVLASGDIVNANQTSHPDLFKALKGGNTNFGIMTRADIASFDLSGIWTGTHIVALNGPQATRSQMLDKISQAMVDVVEGNNEERKTGAQLLISYPPEKPQFAYMSITNTGNVEKPQAAKGFIDIPNRVSFVSSHTNMADYAHQNSQLLPAGLREDNAGLTITNDYSTMRELWDAYDKIYSSLPQKDKIDWIIQFVPQPRIQQSYAEKSGGNSLGLSDAATDQIVVWFMPRWTDPTLDNMVRSAREQFIKITETVAIKRGTYSPFIYLSYAGPGQQPLCGYGAQSVSFLNEVAHKYDPQAVFQQLMPGGFKISKAKCGPEYLGKPGYKDAQDFRAGICC